MAFVRRGSVDMALLLVLFCAVSSALGDEVEERFCTVRGIVGSVQVRLNPNYQKVRREMAVSRPAAGAAAISSSVTEEWTPLRLNMVLGERCEIKTAAQSEVRLETAEGSMIRVEENTHIEILALNIERKKVKGGVDATANTRVKVTDGSLVGNIKKLFNEKQNVRFETPTATAAIRGTTVEVEAQGGANTVVRAFDGTVEVAPAGLSNFTRLAHGKMAEVGQGQRAVIVKDVPKDYRRKGVYLKGEAPPAEDGRGAAPAGKPALAMADTASKAAPAKAAATAVPAKESAPAKAAGPEVPAKEAAPPKAAVPVDSVTITLGSGLGGEKDTLRCYTGATINVTGTVRPAGAVVSVNGVQAMPDAKGVFSRTWSAPAEPGVLTLTISAENGNQVKAVVRTIKVTRPAGDGRNQNKKPGE